MAVQQASTQLPEDPAELDHLIKHRLNSDLKASCNTHWLAVCRTHACIDNHRCVLWVHSLACSVMQSS